MKFLRSLYLGIALSLLLATQLHAAKDSKVEQAYWDSFYSHGGSVLAPTPFAEYCLPKIDSSKVLVELGCGNGRDAHFFARQGLKVVACDLSEAAINQQQGGGNNPTFVSGDFTQLPEDFPAQDVMAVYSRFTMHSVDAQGASRAYRWAYDKLLPGGLFLVEARSVKDDFYGKGERVGKDAFISSHYRRFIRKDELISELETLGFSIEQVVEDKNLATYRDENPVVIRVVAKKPV